MRIHIHTFVCYFTMTVITLWHHCSIRLSKRDLNLMLFLNFFSGLPIFFTQRLSSLHPYFGLVPFTYISHYNTCFFRRHLGLYNTFCLSFWYLMSQSSDVVISSPISSENCQLLLSLNKAKLGHELMLFKTWIKILPFSGVKSSRLVFISGLRVNSSSTLLLGRV